MKRRVLLRSLGEAFRFDEVTEHLQASELHKTGE
jgi:hypothetical protein